MSSFYQGRRMFRCGLLAAAAWMTTATVTQAAEPRYMITDLGELAGVSTSSAIAINDAGIVLGQKNLGIGTTTLGLVWSPAGIHIVPPWRNDEMSLPNAASDDGNVIVGVSTDILTPPPDYTYRDVAVIWQNGVARNLNHLVTGGDRMHLVRANGINADHAIVGYGLTPGKITHAFLFENGRLTDLGSLGSEGSFAFDLNSKKQVIGNTAGQHNITRGFLWENGEMQELGTLGGTTSRASAINEAGQIVGSSSLKGGKSQQAFVWIDGTMHALPGLTAATSIASDINDHGFIVGNAFNAQNFQVATAWIDRRPIDLFEHLAVADPDWQPPSSAFSVNNAGQVVGSAQHFGFAQGFLLTPVNFALVGPDQITAGRVNAFHVRQATPNAELTLLYGEEKGLARIPGCSGATILISQPKAAQTRTADDSGRAVFRFAVPLSAKGKTVRIQVVDQSGCRQSNVLEQAIE